MPKFHYEIRDLTDEIRATDYFLADDDHDAFNVTLNALTKFACQVFPPPAVTQIELLNEREFPIARMTFRFDIDYQSPSVN